MSHHRQSIHVIFGAILLWLLLPVPAALAAEATLQFENDEGATGNSIVLVFPDSNVIGAEVHGAGGLRWPAAPGEECGNAIEFAFAGTIQPSGVDGVTVVRGTVDRTSHAGCDAPARNVAEGDFEVSVEGDLVMGTISFPDEGEPRQVAGEWHALREGGGGTAGSDGSGVNLAFGLFAAAAAADFGATGLCLLKRKRIWFVLGLGLSALVTASAIDAYKLGSDDGLMELGMLVGFGIVVAPLSVALLVAASQPAKPKSWWATHKAQTNAPPPPPAELAAQPPPPPQQ